MRLLCDKIKNRLSNCTALQLLSWCLGFVCFALMFAFRYTDAWQWDDITYLRYILKGQPTDLLLGRPGFMFPYIWLWMFLHNLFEVQFLVIENLIRILNIVFLTLAYVLLFRLLVAVKVSLRIAALTVLFILSELSFSIISSRMSDSALMYMLVLASYLLFVLAHERQNSRYLIGASLLFAYAFLVREPALVYFPFYIVCLVDFYRQKKLFPLKKYLKSGFLFLTICVSVPLILLAVYGKLYMYNFKISAPAYYFSISDLLQKFQLLWKSQINLTTFPLAILGLVLSIKSNGVRRLSGFVISGIASIPFFLPFAELELVVEPRLYMGLFFVVAFGLANLIDFVVKEISSLVFKTVLIATFSSAFMYISYLRFVPEYLSDLQQLSEQKKYYESIKPLLVPNATIIVGLETIYLDYRSTIDGVPIYFISPGWSWPTGKLIARVNKALSNGYIVIYDPKSRKTFRLKREKDLNEMEAAFKLTATKNGFVLVSSKD